MSELFEVYRDLQPIESLVFSALVSNSAYHSMLLLYQKLLRDPQGRLLSNKELGDALGLGETAIKRNLRILRRLGLISVDGARQTRTILVTTHHATFDDRLPRVLKGVESGRVVLEVSEGRVVDTKTDREFDAEQLRLRVFQDPKGSAGPKALQDPRALQDPTTAEQGELLTGSGFYTYDPDSQNDSTPEMAPAIRFGKSSSLSRSRSTKRPSISTRINKLLTEPFYTKAEMPLNAYHLPLAGFDKTKDPYKTDIESIQAHANEVLGTEQSVYGRDEKINERYGIILRALHHFGFTVDQLKQAITNAKNHHYWGTGASNVKDLIKLFRKEANIGELVEYSGSPKNAKVDIRHLESRAIYDKDKIVETFEF